MQVKTLERTSLDKLAESINNWLQRFENSIEVIDIKYSGSGNHGTYSTDQYSAMIIYRNKPDKYVKQELKNLSDELVRLQKGWQ